MRGIECVMNHLHIRDIHHTGDQTINAAKAQYLGTILKEIHEVKLAHDFPDRPCTVDLFIPEDEDDLTAYSLTFWQKKHEFQRVEQCADGKTPKAAQPPH